MMNFIRDISLVPKGLKYKTMIAFSLMSLIPLLICFWLAITYIFPNIHAFLGMSIGNISFILVISLVIALLGLYLTTEMIDPVVRMAGEARVMAEGDVDRMIEVGRKDEIGDLAGSLNIMTQKIRENMEELRIYGERTKLINLEINKKVLVLSGLLQIGNLMSSAAELPVVLNFISERLSSVEDDFASFVMLLDAESNNFKIVSSYNIDKDKLQDVKIKNKGAGEGILVADKNTPASSEMIDIILTTLGLKNIAIAPIIVSRKQLGILALGNRRDDFVFSDDEKEILKLFLKQASIAVENDLLIRRAKELAVKDELTGLYNQGYVHTRLDEEIKRAILYQRPCGYLLIDMDGFKDFNAKFGESKSEILLKAMAEILKTSVTEVDKVGRLEGDKFAVVLPEKNKKQVAAIAEEIRKGIEERLFRVMKTSDRLTVSVGVSENPIDGSTADELIEKADELVKKAKSLGKNRVMV